jgi:hypothetical protein
MATGLIVATWLVMSLVKQLLEAPRAVRTEDVSA